MLPPVPLKRTELSDQPVTFHSCPIENSLEAPPVKHIACIGLRIHYIYIYTDTNNVDIISFF